jgi:hypothetical protein
MERFLYVFRRANYVGKIKSNTQKRGEPSLVELGSDPWIVAWCQRQASRAAFGSLLCRNAAKFPSEIPMVAALGYPSGMTFSDFDSITFQAADEITGSRSRELVILHKKLRLILIGQSHSVMSKKLFVWKQLTIEFDGRTITGSYAEWKGMIIVKSPDGMKSSHNLTTATAHKVWRSGAESPRPLHTREAKRPARGTERERLEHRRSQALAFL